MQTEVKERPILFSGEMVRAILDGRKTQTRRVVKPQPMFGSAVDCNKRFVFDPLDGAPLWWFEVDASYGTGFDFWNRGECYRCPYGVPGDRLRVSEDVTVLANEGSDLYRLTYHADGQVLRRYGTPDLITKIANYKRPRLRGVSLPSAYARITLEVTDVRVERLRDISGSDAIAEGVTTTNFDQEFGAQIEFQILWEKINGKDSWASNPWVWVVEFKRVEGEQ